MQFQMALVNSDKQFILGTFLKAEDANFKVLDLEALNDEQIDCLFFEGLEYENKVITELLGNSSKNFPIRKVCSKDFENNPFEKWDYSKASIELEKYRTTWLLQNNISLLKEIFPTVSHLKALWPNDRTAFFEELWMILKNNLNTKKLTIIFNDIKKATKEHEKNKLIQAKVEGTISPNPMEASEFDIKVLKHYQEVITSHFEIISFDQEKGEIVMTAKIKNSPVLIFAEIFKISKIQEALITSLFTGLQEA